MDNWSLVIQSKTKWWQIPFKEIIRYKDLLFLFVRRDFVTIYKQTLLGPLWFIVQPVLTTIVYTFIFGKVAEIPTDGLPRALFYMTGITAWNYFANCLTKTSTTFSSNAGIFGKVYFPRLIMPMSVVISNLITFLIQFLLLMFFIAFYYFKGADININMAVLLTPVLILMMAGLGLGFGTIISALTTKYRDLKHLVSFGVQLMMYATTLIFPLSYWAESGSTIKTIVLLNPMSSIIEAFRYAFLGQGSLEPLHLLYSFGFMVILLFVGLVVFHKVEKNFMDTV